MATKPVNINDASEKMLVRLPGIGVAYSQQILEKRAELGSVKFEDFSDIPVLQTKMHELLTDGRIVFESVAGSPNGQKQPTGEVQGPTEAPAQLSSFLQPFFQQMESQMAQQSKILSTSLESMLAMQATQTELLKESLKLFGGQVGTQSTVTGTPPGAKRLAPPPEAQDPSNVGAVGGVLPSQQLADIPMYGRVLGAIQKQETKFESPVVAPKSPVMSNLSMVGASKVVSQDVRLQPPSRNSVPRISAPATSSPVPPGPDSRRGMPQDVRLTLPPATSTPLPPGPGPSAARAFAPSYAADVSGGYNRMFPAPRFTYDCRTDFRAFIIKFERAAQFGGWTEEMMLTKLVESLTGNANECYSWQTQQVQDDYELTKQQLMKMYGKKIDPKLERSELHFIIQKTDETIEQFGQRVREKATKAFGDFPAEVFDMAAREAFLSGCTETEAVRLAMMKDPQTLNEAIQETRNAVFNDILLKKRKSKLRRVAFSETDTSTEEQEDMVRQIRSSGQVDSTLHKQMERMNSNFEKFLSSLGFAESSSSGSPKLGVKPSSPRPVDSSNSLSHIQCHRCKEYGHMVRDCPIPAPENGLRSPPASPKRAGSLN